jgi:hypothetical protein
MWKKISRATSESTDSRTLLLAQVFNHPIHAKSDLEPPWTRYLITPGLLGTTITNHLLLAGQRGHLVEILQQGSHEGLCRYSTFTALLRLTIRDSGRAKRQIFRRSSIWRRLKQVNPQFEIGSIRAAYSGT